MLNYTYSIRIHNLTHWDFKSNIYLCNRNAQMIAFLPSRNVRIILAAKVRNAYLIRKRSMTHLQ